MKPWERIVAEAAGAFRGRGRFPLRAYSELMPAPYIGVKPYAPDAFDRATCAITDPDRLDITEYERAHDVDPGLDAIAKVLLRHVGHLTRGQPHGLSRTLLDGNPAWPDELASAARAGQLAHDPIAIVCPLALSRTQDDKGMTQWTLFGGSHLGAACWDGFSEDRLAELVDWIAPGAGNWRLFGDARTVPDELRARLLADEAIDDLRALVTPIPFSRLPPAVRACYLAGRLVLIPSPASLVFYEHPRYRQLQRQLPRAMQIAMLHLFERVEGSQDIRIPQSGWIDEDAHGGRPGGHKVRAKLERRHRWQRAARTDGLGVDDSYEDKVAVALFSTDPVDVELYAKPLARNSQIWTEEYELLLDGPAADPATIERAAEVVDQGGRFGYRMYYPPMRAGVREVFWHVPLIASQRGGRYLVAPPGVVTAESRDEAPIRLGPNLLARPVHAIAARELGSLPGSPKETTGHNVRKLLDTAALLGGPLSVAHARALLRVGKATSVDDWLAALPSLATERALGETVASALRGCIDDAAALPVGPPRVVDRLATRAFEETIWTTIAGLAHGEYRAKNDADGITVNRGKHGGAAAKRAAIVTSERRDLDALGDHLHARYREMIARHGMEGRAEVVDHVFRWETDFAFPWMEGWARNQHGPAQRNIVLVIPGAKRGEAIVMGDHYDTAYMEDVYYEEKGGDLLRAASAGADDNHSATTALLLAAEQLLPLARDGKLARDVWLVHLTGEEYPGDCLGARALCQALVERSLVLTAEDGAQRDMSGVDVVGAFILDMIGHNTHRERDVFQIAPGEGVGSARLARRAHHANLKWNAVAAAGNELADRRGRPRAERVADGAGSPPPFAHLPLHGETRVEWEPTSSLYNTDGQIFSDVGVPVVLFMENYNIDRKGYHDTHDTMENIDLDYCAAMIAIAIETVVDCALASVI